MVGPRGPTGLLLRTSKTACPIMHPPTRGGPVHVCVGFQALVCAPAHRCRLLGKRGCATPCGSCVG